jgi:hypothetical protein
MTIVAGLLAATIVSPFFIDLPTGSPQKLPGSRAAIIGSRHDE